MKKNLLRMIAVFLTLTMLLFALAGLAESYVEPIAAEPATTFAPIESANPEETEEPETTEEPEATQAPEATGEPESTDEPEATEVPENTEVPEATEEPEATDEPEATQAPEATEVPEATVEPETTEEPKATEEPAATEAPVEELTTSPVNNSTTLPDGEYVPSGCTGGSSKVSFSCPKVTVKNGKATATLVISSSKYDYVKASGGKYETSAYSGGGVYANIPIDLNNDNRIVGHTTAMGGKEIAYTICITLDETEAENTPEPTAEPTAEPTEEPGEDTEHEVSTDNKMFKIIRSVLTLKDGKYTAKITLSGTGYDKLYCGTAAQAASDSANWISYSGTYDYEDDGQAKTGYVFTIPVSEVNQPIPLAAYSVSKGVWYDRNVTFTVAAHEPTPAPEASEEPTATPTPTPTPAPTPVILGTPGKVNSSTSLKDGTYTPDKFSWSGGSGRTSISCSKVTVKNGKAYATISFSSSSYAYVKASGSKYYGGVVGGRSTFEIPVNLNANNRIVGMTTAMSADHEIAYTIYIYIEGAKDSADTSASSDPEVQAAQIIGLDYISTDTAEYGKLFKVHHYEGGFTVIDVANVGKYLIAPEDAELPVGIEEEAVIIRQPIMSVHASSANAMQLIQSIIGEETEMTVSAWDYTAPDYAALLKSGSDLIIMPEIFAEMDEGEQTLTEEAAAAIADVKERLAMLGIPMFVDCSADEETEEAKLEWIKVYGILLGCEEAANAYYETAIAALEVEA